MKPLSLCYRLFIGASMALAICYPSLQATTATFVPSEIASETTLEQSGVIGSLENGITYTFIPSAKLKGGSYIKLSCAIPLEKEQAPISLLAQHSLFYGTQKYDREEIAHRFNHLGLDIEADSYLKDNESEKSLQFCLSDSQPNTARELFEILNQMLFFPTLTTENIELARSHLLVVVDPSEQTQLPLQTISTSDLKRFHDQWYRPEHLHVTLSGFNNSDEILAIFAETFGSSIKDKEEFTYQTTTEVEQQKEIDLLTPLAEKVEWTQNHDCLVVDGKIWMKEPNWINKSSNGKTLGALLTILGIVGIGGMIVAFPAAIPAAILAGSLTTITGVYFLNSSYLKDPHYVESMRQIDLQKGCAFAYKNSRAGITLTPYERRALFLQEMVDHPQTLSKLPILLLADLYQLNDPVLAEIFTVDEFNVLARLKRDFVQQRNQYKMLKENLDRELASLTTPYAITRDAGLSRAQEAYNQNYYVVTKCALEVNQDASIADIKRAFEENRISIDERDSLIEQTRAYYEACISAPDFKAGLTAAEITLVQAQMEIQATYSYQVELCKQSMQYNQRMEYYKQGLNSLVNYYDYELHSLLAAFPVYYTIFPDYLDLRVL